ncbi:MAG: TetR-like C-terminal domain-containing protein, partial [Myxococcota bacterium]
LSAGLIALADRAASEREIAELRTQWLDQGQSTTVSLLAEAVGRGELRDGLDVGTTADLLTGGLTYRVAVMGDAVDARFVERLVDTVLQGALARV